MSMIKLNITVRNYYHEQRPFPLFSAKGLAQRCLKEGDNRRDERYMPTVVIVAYRHVILEQNEW